MKKLAIMLYVVSVCLSGSQVYAVNPGVYNFGGTISIDSVFATGGTGQHAANGTGYFCIQGLVVGEPDVNGVQTITGSDDPVIQYGVFITGIRLAIVECIDLVPSGQITGFIDNDGYNNAATITTTGTDCDFFGVPCGWETEIHAPAGPAGTVVMTIPLESSLLQNPPPWVHYGDPAATSLTAIAEMYNEDGIIFGQEQYTMDMRSGAPLVGASLNIVSPDVHFGPAGLVIEDILSWTRFNGIFSQGPCPAEKPSWNSCSTIGSESEASHAFNYLLILLLPALFISIGVIGRRK